MIVAQTFSELFHEIGQVEVFSVEGILLLTELIVFFILIR